MVVLTAIVSRAVSAMFKRTLLLLALIASPVSAEDYDPHRKSPPPLPKKVSCLRVYNKPRCIPISRRVIDNFGLVPGQSVSAKTMFKLDEANKAYIKNKLR